MAKLSQKLKVRLPSYRYPRYTWRKTIHKAVLERAKESNISYDRNARLELQVRLYFDSAKLSFVDVDNRLKDIMDALQGRVGGKSKQGELKPIIPNDSQVYKVIVEKGRPPGQSHGLGHLVIAVYKGSSYKRL